jgi:hypothetical protein
MKSRVVRRVYRSVAPGRATLAVVALLAVGGTANAASGLIDGSQIKDVTITTAEIKPHSIGPERLNDGAVAVRTLAPGVRALRGARAAGAAGARPVRCRVPARAHVLARDSSLVAWKRVVNNPPEGRRDLEVWVCSLVNGRALRAFTGPPKPKQLTHAIIAHVKADGGAFAFVASTLGNPYSEQLYVDDARRGKQLFSTLVTVSSKVDDLIGFGGNAIDARGDVAWIVYCSPEGASVWFHTYPCEAMGESLFVHTAAGRRTLATGHIWIGMLAIAGGTVTWNADGQAGSAPVSG